MGLGLGLMTYASVLSSEYVPCAIEDIKKEKEKKGVDKLSLLDSIKLSFPYILPVGVYLFAGTKLILDANDIVVKKEAAAMAAYTLAVESKDIYRQKIKEVLGDKKEKDVNEAVAKELLEKNPVSKNEIIITGKGETLCYEKISGRYFRSDIETLKKIQNELNRRMIDMTFISLNELYLQMGLSPVLLGDELGWDIGRGLIEMRFSAQLTDDGDPCLVVDFEVGPKQF